MSKTKEPPKRRGKAVKAEDGTATFEAGGGAAPKAFDAAAVSEAAGLWWENGGGESFWLRNSGGWAKWPASAVGSMLTQKFVRKTKREGEFLSDQERLLLHVREHRMVEMVLPALSGYMCGIHTLGSGERVMVRHSPRLVKPEKGEWPTIRALIEGKLDFSLLADNDGIGIDQSLYFHGWMKTALEGLYLGGPGNFRPGQCLIFAGPGDVGKSRLQHQLITGLLGGAGRSADPGPYLFGRTDFNNELFGAEHLMMEELPSGSKTADRVFFGEMLKQLVVNDTQRLHRKREDAMVVSPFFRVTISINDDPDKLRVLPLLTPDLKDKVMLFHISPAPLPMPTTTLGERRAFRDRIDSELPAYAHWLLEEFAIPEEMRSTRFGVKEWHHPVLAMELFDDTPAAELLALIDAARWIAGDSDLAGKDTLWDLTSMSKQEGVWEGTAIELEKLLLAEEGVVGRCSVAREAKKLVQFNKVERLLGRLKEDRRERVQPHRTNQGRRWRISCP